ncbi:uncharacterized protein LOC107661756 [Sinocyclocheilus anshuiensis]|uniref:uncharacterized protein LOC107661756 n=1 Tax=Sinocyclocheilus anshuiensis TaxID=1608454 RepID=UPI0007BAAD32|nr:PREDICTED: uncharacterized protein LOC107661756 [Sinocyclocheilus anshuiensis]
MLKVTVLKVHGPSLYITDDNNVALFPAPDGHFSLVDLTPRGHYEVHGESIIEESSPNTPVTPNPTRFFFHRPVSAAAGSATGSSAVPRATMPKTFQRSVFIAEVVDCKLETSKTLTVRFSEFEASVPGIVSKVKEALGQEDSLILTDGQGKEILDSEGTRGSAYWKQNARKVFAVPQEEFLQLRESKRRRLSRRDDAGLQDVLDTIEEVVTAAQGLQAVSTTLKELMDLANSNRRTTVSLTDVEAAAVRDAFACIICRGPMNEPMVSSCCQSLIGCRICIKQWQINSPFCPKCRAGDSGNNIQRLMGLSDALAALRNILLA